MSIHSADILRRTFIARMEHHTALDSTNDRAAQCAKEGADALPLLIVADDQTAGRGRNANRWWTGAGSLAMSLLVPPEMVEPNRERSPLVAMATAVAVIDAVAPLLPKCRVGIHWPNDVVVQETQANDRKLAGILVEVLPSRQYVIGIGLNTNNTLADAPSELRARICTMRDLLGAAVDQNEIVIRLLHCLEQAFDKLRTDPGDIARQADVLCVQRNCEATVNQGGSRTTGHCRGIGLDGALLIDTPTGLQRVVSGTVQPRA